MTSAIRTGRVAFVGAGPGDPGLLTVRAVETMGTAGVLVTDPDVPAAIIVLAIGAEIRHAVGEPAAVAKGLVEAARQGHAVVRMVAGDVLSADPVVAEIEAVARSGVAFDVIPGIPAATAAAAYAGIPVGSVHTIADVRSASDWSGWPARPAPCCCRRRPVTWRTPRRHWPRPGSRRPPRPRSPHSPPCPPSARWRGLSPPWIRSGASSPARWW